MDNYDIKDITLAEGGRRRMDWAEHEMPVLFSAQSGEGKGELWKAIDRVLRAGDESVPDSA